MNHLLRKMAAASLYCQWIGSQQNGHPIPSQYVRRTSRIDAQKDRGEGDSQSVGLQVVMSECGTARLGWQPFTL